MKQILFLAWLSLTAAGTAQARDLIWDTHAGKACSVDEFAATRQNGEILVFGEQHATPDHRLDPSMITHHHNQVRLLERLIALKRDTRINTGMEFISYDHQETVDSFLQDALAEDQFLKAIEWGKNPFEFYRQQVLLPRQSGGHTVALNIPKTISAHVAKGGPGALTEEERRLLPPLWERGRQDYFERFREVMGDHVPAEKLENYFWSQSLWDDAMAWNALKHSDAKSMTVILVGEFHVEFGHGLPARLLRHGATKVTTLLQVETDSVDEPNLRLLTAPDPRYGPRADFLWLHVIAPNGLQQGAVKN